MARYCPAGKIILVFTAVVCLVCPGMYEVKYRSVKTSTSSYKFVVTEDALKWPYVLPFYGMLSSLIGSFSLAQGMRK